MAPRKSDNPALDKYEQGGGSSPRTTTSKGSTSGKKGKTLTEQLTGYSDLGTTTNKSGRRVTTSKVTPPLPQGSPSYSQSVLGLPGRPGVTQAADAARSRYGSYGYNSFGETKQLYYSKDLDVPASWGAQAIMEWQLQMINVGLISEKDKDKIKLGAWDNVTRKAYQQVLEHANRSGMTKEESLNELTQAEEASKAAGLGGAGGSGSPISLSNPTDLRETFRQTYIDRVGHSPTNAALDSFVRTFHDQERAAKTAYADGEPGSIVTDAPSAGNAAQADIDKQYGAEQQAYQTIKRENDFFSMLGPIGGQ